MSINLQPETKEALASVTPGTVSWQSQELGIHHGEPLIVALDVLLRFAKAYETRMGMKLADDPTVGAWWFDALEGIHGLLNCDGAVAMERNCTTDSKDNGACERIYWAARDAAGFYDESGPDEA